MTSNDQPDPAAIAAFLRVVLDAVEAREIDARPGEVAYLAGAAEALAMLSADEFPSTPLRDTSV